MLRGRAAASAGCGVVGHAPSQVVTAYLYRRNRSEMVSRRRIERQNGTDSRSSRAPQSFLAAHIENLNLVRPDYVRRVGTGEVDRHDAVVAQLPHEQGPLPGHFCDNEIARSRRSRWSGCRCL